jgi:L-fuconate dehydratase
LLKATAPRIDENLGTVPSKLACCIDHFIPGKKNLVRLRDPKITNVRVLDIRFPTSRERIGSDAVNEDPDYSAAYCVLETDGELQGHGFTFTLGRGTELCAAALRYLSRYVLGRQLSSLTENVRRFSGELTRDSQFRWLGPEKGVIHLATAALINSVWDLCAQKKNRCGNC